MSEELLLNHACESVCGFLLEIRGVVTHAKLQLAETETQQPIVGALRRRPSSMLDIDISRDKWQVQKKCLEAHREVVVESALPGLNACAWFGEMIEIGDEAFTAYGDLCCRSSSGLPHEQLGSELEQLCDDFLLRTVDAFWDALIPLRESSDFVCRRLFAENILQQAQAQNFLPVLRAYERHLNILDLMPLTEETVLSRRRLAGIVSFLRRTQMHKVNALIRHTAQTAELAWSDNDGDGDGVSGWRASDETRYAVFDYELCFFATGPSYRLLAAAYLFCKSQTSLLLSSGSCEIETIMESVEGLIMLNAHLQGRLKRMKLALDRRKHECTSPQADLDFHEFASPSLGKDFALRSGTSDSAVGMSDDAPRERLTMFGNNPKLLSVASAFLRAQDWMINAAQLGSLILEALHNYSIDKDPNSLTIDWPMDSTEVANMETDELLQLEFFTVSSLAFNVCQSLATMAIRELSDLSQRLPGRARLRHRLRRKLASWSTNGSEVSSDSGQQLWEDAAQLFCKWLPVLACNLQVLDFVSLPSFFGVPIFVDVEAGSLALAWIKKARTLCLDTTSKLMESFPSLPLPLAFLDFVAAASNDPSLHSEAAVRALTPAQLNKTLLKTLSQKDIIFTTLGVKIVA